MKSKKLTEAQVDKALVKAIEQGKKEGQSSAKQQAAFIKWLATR